MRHRIHLFGIVPEVVTTNSVNVRGSRAGFEALILTIIRHFLGYAVNVSGARMAPVSDVISPLL